jgi:hypothetical protein
MFTGSPHGSGLLAVAAVGHVLAFELTSDRPPLFKSMANVLTLFPTPLLPWVSTYNTPVGRDEELPQFTRNKLRAHRPASAITPPIFFDINSPRNWIG